MSSPADAPATDVPEDQRTPDDHRAVYRSMKASSPAEATKYLQRHERSICDSMQTELAASQGPRARIATALATHESQRTPQQADLAKIAPIADAQLHEALAVDARVRTNAQHRTVLDGLIATNPLGAAQYRVRHLHAFLKR